MEDKDKKIESLHLKLMPYLEKYGILLLLVIMILVMHILQPDSSFNVQDGDRFVVKDRHENSRDLEQDKGRQLAENGDGNSR